MRRSGRSIRKSLKLKGIRRVKQDGKIYRYHRASGIRLPDDLPEDHADFLAAYIDTEKARSDGKAETKRTHKPKSATLAHSWWLFYKSNEFADLSEGYRRRIQAMVTRSAKLVARCRSISFDPTTSRMT